MRWQQFFFDAIDFVRRRGVSDSPHDTLRPRLRFAVLCDSPLLERWQVAALRELQASGDSNPVAVVVAENRLPKTASDRGAFQSFIQPSERELADSIDDFFRSAGAVVPSLKLDVGGERTSSEGTNQRNALATLGLDFILYLGFGPCDAELSRFAVRGLWRFRFGDVSKYANYPPGVWEIVSGDPVTVAVLCSQQPGGRDAIVLRSGVFATNMHQSNANAAQVLAEISHWPAYIARIVRLGHLDEDGVRIELPAVPFPVLPELGVRARLAWCLLKHKIARLPNLFFDDEWNVGLVDEPIHGFLQPNASRRASWFPNRDRNQYLADPMGSFVDGKRVVLCESYDYKTRLGSLSSLGIDDRGWIPSVSRAIPTSVHVSYPYLFKVNDDLYCVPETSQARETALYRLTIIPNGYQPVRVLLPGFACLDPTLFEYADRWWLFCTDAADGEHTKLHVWFASDLLGEFVPHPLNPVKIDVRSARPAGTPFVHEGRLYRPSQDSSRTYGGAVTINEITRLTPTHFQERAVASVRPIPRSGYEFGLHTLSSLGDMTLIDSKRRIFTGGGLREKIDSVLARIFRR